ncbi:MAG: biotin--[acetyl-CoA-carboxylase] ligase [Candidatus Cloacimonadaceae bacterium]
MNKLSKKTDCLIHLSKTGSTMSDAIEMLSAMKFRPDSLLIVADEQQKSIGRNNSQWLSPQGGLWFTYCLKANQVSHQITLLLGLCLLLTLTEHFPDLHNSLQIKWPNDLIIDDKKLSGILVQHQQGFLIIGMGINTNTEQINLDVPMPPVSLKQIFSFEISNIALLDGFLDNFQKKYPYFLASGLQQFYQTINCSLYGLNKTLIFDTDKEQISGICRGISEDGALLLEKADGKVLAYYSGSIINSPV